MRGRTWSRKKRVFRKSPYQAMRFHLCRKQMFLGGADCTTPLTGITDILMPGEDVAAAHPDCLIPGPLIDTVSKSVVLGGMRFWFEWAINTDDIPADYANLITMASVLFFFAKVPMDPETNNHAYIPAPMTLSHQGDRAQRENILWSKLYHIPLGFNDGQTSTQIISSSGANASRDTTFVSFNGWDSHPHQYRVKTKRTLSEYDALVFGVSSVTGVGGEASACPIVVDLHGQLTIKRGRKTNL